MQILNEIKDMIQKIEEKIEALEKKYTKKEGRELRALLDAFGKNKVGFKKALIEYEKSLTKKRP
jgi:Mg2+ and Co2+ transporter CorA